MRICDNCLIHPDPSLTLPVAVQAVPVGQPPERQGMQRKVDLCDECLEALLTGDFETINNRYRNPEYGRDN